MPRIDKQNFLAHARSEEERLMLSKLLDGMRISEKTGRAGFSGFLSPADLELAGRVFSDDAELTLFGGYADAERCVVGFNAEEWEFPIAVLLCEGKFEGLTHRDFLGSLMSLGITREIVGDICIDGDRAYIFHLASMSDYIAESLTEVKRTRVKNTVCDVCDVNVERKYEDYRKSIASSRVDAVIGAAFNMSRTDAAETVERDLVSVNYRAVASKDKKICSGDVISVRGKGKVKVILSGDVSKKGRLFIDIKKYM